jgi:hypothetical protein
MDNETRLLELDIEIELKRTEISMKEEEDPTNSWDEFCEYMKPEWDALAKLDRERRMLITPEYRDREIEVDDDVMSMDDFIEAVNQGCFIDYDGFGSYVKDGKISNIRIYPSDVQHNSVRKDFDTIIWFNK